MPWPKAASDNPWRKETKPSFRPPLRHAPGFPSKADGDDSPPTTRLSEPPPPGASALPAPRITSGLEPRTDRRSRELERVISGLPNRVLAGRWEVLDPFAASGTAAVYAAIDVELGEPRAIKLLYPSLSVHSNEGGADPETSARFLDEARAQQQIRSPHVVRVFEAEVSDEIGVPFIVMERLVGDDLGSELERRERLPPPEVVGYLRQLAFVLDEAHSIGIVHRDLKPANLFATLSAPPRPEGGARLLKVLDFGVARFVGEPRTDGESPDRTLVGTPWYMSPEQASGRAHDAGPASDRWALGILAFRLLTGMHYWTSEALDELIPEILAGPTVDASKRGRMLGAHFDAWFYRACAVDPRGRFPTAAMQVLMLSKALAEDGVRVWVQSAASPPLWR